jgi:hypothetical protein
VVFADAVVVVVGISVVDGVDVPARAASTADTSPAGAGPDIRPQKAATPRARPRVASPTARRIREDMEMERARYALSISYTVVGG